MEYHGLGHQLFNEVAVFSASSFQTFSYEGTEAAHNPRGNDSPIKARKVEKTKKIAEHYEFDYADMVKNSIAPTEVVTSMNQTTKMTYKIAEKGLFVFFNKSTKEAVLITVE